MSDKQPTSIWYFLGILLLVYGVVVVGATVWQFLAPLDQAAAASDVPPSVWALAFLALAIGVIYLYYLDPRRQK